METLRPPTDNIYKFAAVLGLAVFVAGFWGYRSDRMKVDSLQVEADKVLLEYNSLREEWVIRWDQESEDIDKRAEVILDPSASEEAKKGATRWLEEFTKRDGKTARVAHIDESLLTLLDRVHETQSALSANRSKVSTWGPQHVALMLLGGGIAAFGFRFWYLKTQRWRDQLLKSEASQSGS